MPEIVRQILPYIGAAAIAFVAYMLGGRLVYVLEGGAAHRVQEMAGGLKTNTSILAGVKYGSEEHRLRLAFARFKMDVNGKEKTALFFARIVAGVVVFLILNVIAGFPLVTSLIGFVGGVLIVNGFINGAWSKSKQEIEKDIPGFLSGLSSTIQVVQNMMEAVEEEAKVLTVTSPLRQWLLERFIERLNNREATTDEILQEAASISSALGVAVFLIIRTNETGGSQWRTAFETAVQNLEGVLDARIAGQAIGAAAKGSVQIIAGATGLMIISLVRNPTLAAAMSSPLVQIMYAIIIVVMIFGWGFINNLVDETV